MKEKEETIYFVGIYARLSVDHGVKNESIASQIAIAKAYLAQLEKVVIYRFYIDLGESGTHFKRSGFLQLMEDIRAKKVNCVIVKDFSRFGRNYLEVGNYIDNIFPFLGVRFISVIDGFDSCKKEENKIDRNLKNLLYDFYAYDTARKVKEIKKLRQKEGNYIGSKAPYGYQIERKKGKRSLVEDKEAFFIVEKLIQLYQEGKSQKEMVIWLYQNRVHRPSDYRKTGHVYCLEEETLLEWQRGSIQQILKRSEIEKKNPKRVRKQEKKQRKQEIQKRIGKLEYNKKPVIKEVWSICILLLQSQMFQEKWQVIENDVQIKKEELIKRKEKELRQVEMKLISIKRIQNKRYREYQTGKIVKETFLAEKCIRKEKVMYLEEQKKKKVQKIQKIKQQWKKAEDWSIDRFLPYIVKKIEFLEKKHIVIQFGIRKER